MAVVKATILLPTLDEAASIEAVIRALLAAKPPGDEYEILVVDDGSRDGTQERVRALAGALPVRLVEGPRHGLTGAVLAGAAAAAHPIVGAMDADGSHPANRMPDLLRALESGETDLAIGSRYAPGGAIEDWPLSRRIMSRAGLVLVRLLTPVRDPFTGYFAARRDFILERGRTATGQKMVLELVCHLPPGAKTKEFGIRFVDRTGGRSKLTLRVRLQFLAQYARLLARRVTGRRG